MRTKEEVQRMLGKAVNATPFMPVRNMVQRDRKSMIYMAIQTLNWVLTDDSVRADLTKNLEDRIEMLSSGAGK